MPGRRGLKPFPGRSLRSAAATGLLPIAAACAPPAEPPSASELLDRINVEAAAARGDLIEIRRHLHMHPELSGQERETAALVAERLRRLGLEVRTGIGGHGVVGVLKGARPGPVVAYRADMDAVETEVVGDSPYRSRVPGVKHVCGHDAHVAVGLGVAQVLASIREDLPGTVKFIFQPAEESVQGARAMIGEGVLEDPSPEAIFAVHAAPIPTGSIGCPAGVGLTGWDPFEIRLEASRALEEVGREVAGALAALSTVAYPRNGREWSSVLQGIFVEGGPLEDFVYVHVANAVPSAGEPNASLLRGQVRAAGTETYERTRRRFEETLAAVTEGRARFELEFGERFPDMHGDPELVRAAMEPIEAALGEGTALPIRASVPFFGEDFALFQERVPGAMFFLGTANEERGITSLNHSPDYDIDEGAIEAGTVAMANVLLAYLRTH